MLCTDQLNDVEEMEISTRRLSLLALPSSRGMKEYNTINPYNYSAVPAHEAFLAKYEAYCDYFHCKVSQLSIIEKTNSFTKCFDVLSAHS